jgi:hypothetical protein
MHPSLPLLLALALPLRAGEATLLAEDDATSPQYRSSWGKATGGLGFHGWDFRTRKKAEGDSHAGFYLATTQQNPDLNGIAIRGKAFGLYANGAGFEAAVAFRPLKKPLTPGQTFSFLLEHRPIEKRSTQDDPATGAIGLALRTGRASENVEDYKTGARFEFGCYEGGRSYLIFDGTAEKDTGIPLTDGGLSVSLTLVTADTYDLEVTTLADHQTFTFKGRRLAGPADTKIESFAIFNRDGEKSDAYFNGFQIIE